MQAVKHCHKRNPGFDDPLQKTQKLSKIGSGTTTVNGVHSSNAKNH
jgi:hypothetical protein